MRHALSLPVFSLSLSLFLSSLSSLVVHAPVSCVFFVFVAWQAAADAEARTLCVSEYSKKLCGLVDAVVTTGSLMNDLTSDVSEELVAAQTFLKTVIAAESGAAMDIEGLKSSRDKIDCLSKRVFKPLHILPGGVMLIEVCDKLIIAHGKDDQAEAELSTLVVEAASLHPPTDISSSDYFEQAGFVCFCFGCLVRMDRM